MSTNKHAIIRYRTIDRCLRERNKKWNWKSLADACAVEIMNVTEQNVKLSERTIKGDLAEMRSNDILGYNAPIEYDRREKSYYYADSDFSIVETPINQKDQNDLHRAIEVLQQLGGLKDVLGIQSVLTKLQHFVHSHEQKNVSKVIYFDAAEQSSGQEHLYRFYQSIVAQKALNIVYKKFGSPAKSYIISPYLLKEYQKRWYLLAYDHTAKDLRTFGLDRIESIKDSLSDFFVKDDFDGYRYFNNVVGIQVDFDKEPVEIVFMAFGVQINYFKTRPLHPSQVLLHESKEMAKFQIQVVPNYELLNELMSYRQYIQVISPSEIVDEIKDSLHRLNTLYPL
jgi:predicted DNA-binding transcriptional regulator YafY